MPWYLGRRQVASHLEKDRCLHFSKKDNGCVPRQTAASKAMQLDARLGRFPRAMRLQVADETGLYQQRFSIAPRT